MTTLTKWGRPRDSQRQKVYRAEDAAFPAMRRMDPEFADINDCHRWLTDLLGQKTVQKRFPAARSTRSMLKLGTGAGARSATAYAAGCRIVLPRWARNKWVMCHELAHLLVDRDPSWRMSETAPHGWQFCAAYLWLIRRALGQEAHDALKASFKARKVRFTKPRAGRKMTEEQKAAFAERMAAARAAKG